MRGLIGEIVAEAGISRRTWNYLLNGTRNASPDAAKRLERVTGIDKGLWVFGSAKKRQEAWEKELRRRERAWRRGRL